MSEPSDPEGILYGFDADKYGLEDFRFYRSYGQTYAVAQWGDFIYLANGSEGIALLLRTPIKLVVQPPLPGFAMDIVIADGVAYVAQGTDADWLHTSCPGLSSF